MNQVYQYIQERIVNALQDAIENGGVAPWHKPWAGGMVNYISRHPYRGINRLLLPQSGEYITFKQIQDLQNTKKYKHIKIKKGSHKNMVVFWKINEVEDQETGEVKIIPLLRYYNVFNIKDVEGLQTRFTVGGFNPREDAEKLISGYLTRSGVTVEHIPGSNDSFYVPSLDKIQLPSQCQFENAEAYYGVLFHECVHSTGKETRLNREFGSYGAGVYSKEELVAEIGSSMICAELGFNEALFDNSVSYLKCWLSKIQDDVALVTTASQQAQKAADMIQGKSAADENVREECKDEKQDSNISDVVVA